MMEREDGQNVGKEGDICSRASAAHMVEALATATVTVTVTTTMMSLTLKSPSRRRRRHGTRAVGYCVRLN
jgi:hypothetical protein